ncbi:Deleted in autism protein 1 [Paragonimus heterotremus]|uniref:Deleted in autism protein 1 n=1 Tax=Paragonimus heterotremus TaxID=100268 RepID=A0A8J4SVN3_9TREM|nr:Deleted in autism protein 1 [Paragonimus heterotremus]
MIPTVLTNHILVVVFFSILLIAGLYETARKVYLRRIGSPATPEAVDAAVCRRGPQQGLPQASDAAKAKLKCIPHLAIWRWRPTNDPVEGASGDPVDSPLHRGLVAAPVFTNESDLEPVKAEQAWTERVMPTTFSPITRCASDRLFSHLQSNFRERTSFKAETRWLRFDELMFLFNLAIDSQAVLWQAFPRTGSSWPFPTYIGACGRWILQDYHGVPLSQFCGAPFWLRLRILLNILELPDRLERSSSGTLSRFADPTGRETDGYAVYLGNFDLASLFTVNPYTYNITVANLRHAIVVDTETLNSQGFSGPAEYVVPSSATRVVLDGISQHKCEGKSNESGDAGGTTPPCVGREHADALCTHVRSDHNFWAVCTSLVHGSQNASECRDFLIDIPNELHAILARCAYRTDSATRRELVQQAKHIVLKLIQEHPEPRGL